MPKADTTTTTPVVAAPSFKPLRIGETITVKAGAGRRVPNDQAGDYFSEKDAVTVTVDVRIIRLVKDEDLIRTK
jgi:hypothetical protein